MSTITLNGDAVMGAEIVLPDRRNWTAMLIVDSDAAPTAGTAEIAFAAPDGSVTVFNGTTLRSEFVLGRGQAWIIGGAGGLRTEIDGQDFIEQTPALIMGYILGLCGESAGDISRLIDLPRMSPRFAFAAGSAGQALDELMAALGLSWRVGLDGLISVPPATLTAYEITNQYVEIDPVDVHGRLVAALDAPDLIPGMTIGGRTVRQVRHLLNPGTEAFRTVIQLEAA